LVEVAIMLAAVGIILGGAVIPLWQKRVSEDQDAARRQLDDVHAAIAGYAMRHRTPGVRYVLNVQEASSADATDASSTRSFWIPAGRPYLPCPDYDGDGVENRLSVQNAMLMQHLFGFVADIKPVRTDSTSFLGSEVRPAVSAFGGGTIAQRSLVRYGSCGVSPADGNTDRGALPWKTLGVRPSDLWGTRHTYRVDQVWASALTGFGQETPTDGYDPRLPLWGVDDPAGRRLMPLRNHWDIEARGSSNVAAYTPAAMVPSLVCGIHDSGASDNMPNRCDPLPLTGTSFNLNEAEAGGLRAGSVASEAGEWTADNLRPVPFPAGDLEGLSQPGRIGLLRAGAVTEGVPYVVVSHGSNRLFGFDHRTLTEEIGRLGDPNPCVWQTSSANRAELSNDGVADIAFTSPGEAHNSPCALEIDGDDGDPALFVALPQTDAVSSAESGGASRTFDDIVEWRTRAQLNDQLTSAGVFPVLPLPLLVTR